MMSEKRIGEILADALNEIEREFGVRVEMLEVEWMEVTNIDSAQERFKVRKLSMNAESR